MSLLKKKFRRYHALARTQFDEKDALSQVLDLVDKLREAFKEMIDHLDWMSYITKQIAKEKVSRQSADWLII